MILKFFHASFTESIYHEILPGKTDRLNGALEVDSGFLLWVTRVGEVDLSTSPLHDMFDVAAISTHHKEMMLRCDVQLCAHGDCRGQAPSQVFQEHGCSFLGGKGETSETVLTGTLKEVSDCSLSCHALHRQDKKTLLGLKAQLIC